MRAIAPPCSVSQVKSTYCSGLHTCPSSVARLSFARKVIPLLAPVSYLMLPSVEKNSTLGRNVG